MACGQLAAKAKRIALLRLLGIGWPCAGGNEYIGRSSRMLELEHGTFFTKQRMPKLYTFGTLTI